MNKRYIIVLGVFHLFNSICAANKIDTFKLLRCGLYLNSKGELGYKSQCLIDENGKTGTTYIKWIYRDDEIDTIGDGGIRNMNMIIDTSSFRELSIWYFKDKNYVYVFSANSSGGIISILTGVNPNYFIILSNNGYAKAKNTIYFKNEKIKKVHLKTFKILSSKHVENLAKDKYRYYIEGKEATQEQKILYKLN